MLKLISISQILTDSNEKKGLITSAPNHQHIPSTQDWSDGDDESPLNWK